MRPRILTVAAEAVPLAKTGGLGDVIAALSAALGDGGIDATMLIPGYRSALDSAKDLKRIGRLVDIPGGESSLWRGRMPDTDADVILLRNDALYGRGGNPYLDSDGKEYADNALRFAALCHAAASIAAGKGGLPAPHIVHAHDWHAGLTPLLMRERRVSARSVFTIHNLAFQGNYPIEMAESLGIPASRINADGIEYWGQLSFMKAGLRFADKITTVSRSYAKEILTPKFGHGFDGLLRERAADLVAVPNGVDIECWDPQTDRLIARNFSVEDMKGKTLCKRDLQKTFGLPVDPFAPVMAMGSRLTGQKMADVVAAALPAMLQTHERLQVVILGCGEQAIEAQLQQLAAAYPDRLAVHIGYDEKRAHVLHAGADILMHGSRFEPFGLTPIYSMRYGTIPIVSRVGGLADTVVDLGDIDAPNPIATGISFEGEETDNMLQAVDRALAAFAQPPLWRALQRGGMTAVVDWHASSQLYIELYRGLLDGRSDAVFIDPHSQDAVLDITALSA